MPAISDIVTLKSTPQYFLEEYSDLFILSYLIISIIISTTKDSIKEVNNKIILRILFPQNNYTTIIINKLCANNNSRSYVNAELAKSALKINIKIRKA